MKAKRALAWVGIAVGLFSGSWVTALDVLPEKAPTPEDNPTTPEKVELGRMLFFETRLSSTETISCNSCHNVQTNGSAPVSVSKGIFGRKGNRKSPSVFNAAFYTVQFWDGRAPTLEEQAKGPMINPVEMGLPDHQTAVQRLSDIPDYKKRFKDIFGEEKITIDQIVKAIAAYERTLITPDSPYDRYLKGEKTALSPAAVRGENLVKTEGCIACHNGPFFSGPSLPMGQGFFMKFPTFAGSEFEKKYHLAEDPGRYKVTKDEKDKNMWRVSSWRNVAIRAPYFHNGSVKTLDEAVRVMAKTQLNKTFSDAQVHDIVEFLKSLTGKLPKETPPALPAPARALVTSPEED